ncbi:pyruvate:ferredoxin (flavodoxin) oxidoreductase [Tabrizicola caldifontis]|uniref:pyruvate:ferredoxin (flavodoxin) oxidoreductase n=1 Tax=Tabrizicola caldifontis TaxID=2528036 RepID=UPI00107FE342|nr:pyruvate:ferredoxin (flavodoxin) oxidoreductase [Rhodobacter sp. YIM 73028]
MSGPIRTIDANEAVADIAYRLSEVVAIYPITPASVMGEHADQWAADGRANLWDTVPQVVEMQSEGGAAGAVHGALTAGALTTTFTASQGLLLMLPDLYKIAGELTPFCLHVAARSVATHALSIFGDHSDVMAVRGAGLALLASGTAQEAQDLAAIGHAVTLAARVPVLHFFDGFRTSHEIRQVEGLSDDMLRALIDDGAVAAHRARALNPERPAIRGTSQNPDTFFQGREAAEPFSAAFPDRLAETMARFADLTGRRYGLFDYAGDPKAERVVILMGSGAETAEETVDALVARGAKVGVLRVRLFRPFSTDHLLAALPETVTSLAVLDRTKEPGSSGEPLLQEVTMALALAVQDGRRAGLPRIIGARYGLGGKDFTPGHVKALFDEMARDRPKARVTLGIRDDVSGTSLDPDRDFERSLIAPDVAEALFFGLGSDGTVSGAKATIKLIGEHTGLHVQGHFEYDSRKAGQTTISHLRISPRPIRATYGIAEAGFVAVHAPEFLQRRDIFARARPGAMVLVNTPLDAARFWDSLSREAQAALIDRACKLHVIDAYAIAGKAGLGRRINMVMQACFLALSDVLPRDTALAALKDSVAETWGKRGPEVVRRNVAAIDAALAGLRAVPLPERTTSTHALRPSVPTGADDFAQRVTRALLDGQGDELPVSAFPPDGTWPSGSSRLEKRAIALEIPVWEPDLCVQCTRCAMICPHAAIRVKVFDPGALADAPQGFRSRPEAFEPALEGMHYTVQVAPEDCTGCGLCIELCPARDRQNPKRKALNAAPLADHLETERAAWEFFLTLPSAPLDALPIDRRTASLREPLFEFSGACAGCGETPYLRLLSELFGDRLLIANATGCSSIYGGNLPTTPWTKNAEGRGPAWSNSLFEDNAEFGLGMRLALDSRRARVLAAAQAVLPERLAAELAAMPRQTADPAEVTRIRALLAEAAALAGDGLAHDLDALLPTSLWIVGGDGWAYDIGYGGLDHVLASGRKVNVLVLDTEVYSNTGGQASKATPTGASAKFAVAGKEGRKKDLGLLAMSYGHVYVAEVGLQARPDQTVQAMLEAEAHPGPSLIIAASPCIAHGYDLAQSPRQQRRAISAGALIPYRFDPARIARGEAPLQLDAPEPSLDMVDYMGQEARFRMVELRSPERARALLQAAREGARQRQALYRQLSGIHLPTDKEGDDD